MLALEIAAFVAGALASLRWPIYALIGLLAIGSYARWRRNLGWGEPRVAFPGLAAVAGAAGLLALALAVAVASPFLEGLTERSIEWTQLATIRGNLQLLVLAGVLVVAQAAAAELVLRRWLLDRVLDTGARPIVAVAIAAAAEAAITGGHPAARLGAGLAGVGYGLLYTGGGRRLDGPIAARVVFELGALVLVWGRWV